MILKLFDGTTEMALDTLDELVTIFTKHQPEFYVLMLDDERGLINNNNYDQIIEALLPLKAILLIKLTSKDNISEDQAIYLDHLISSYGERLQIIIELKNLSDLSVFNNIFRIENIKNVSLAYTITNNTPDIIGCLNKIVELNLNNCLILPVDHSKNLDYKKITKIIANYTTYRKNNNIELQLGCGFPLCSFTNEDLGILYNSPIRDVLSKCGPKVIINPDLTAHYCEYIQEPVIDIREHGYLYNLHRTFVKETIKIPKEVCGSCWSAKKLCGRYCAAVKD